MGFNKDLAIKMLGYSQKAYSELTWSYKNTGFLLELDKFGNQILAFPGSEQLQDWADDSEFVKVKREGLGYLHNGISDEFDEIKLQVLNTLNKNKTVTLTGHSLGAGLASIFALYLFNLGFKIECVYTYGSPRVGNSEWAEKFKNSGIQYYRVVNGNDIVPTIPKLFFYHVGEEVHINKRGWLSWLHNNFLDHKLENYLQSLNKL